MYIILCYDVDTKRCARVMKTAKKYLHPVQRSVFEGNCTESRLNQLKAQLERLIDPETDAIAIYQVDPVSSLSRSGIGQNYRAPDGFF